MEKTVSQIDIKNLEIIRNGVKDLLLKASIYDKKGIKVLDVAPQIYNGAKEFFSVAEIFTLDLDENSGADFIEDLCNDNSDIIESNFFDFIICTEVLEHTLNPFNASKELYRILKPNGKLFVTTPYNFRIHGPLPDCWRFTEYGLKSIFSIFSQIEITSIDDKDRFLMPIQYHSIMTK